MSEFDYNPTINVKSRIRKLNDRKEHLTKTSELVLGSSSGMNNFQNTGGFNNTGNFSNSGNDVGGYIPRQRTSIPNVADNKFNSQTSGFQNSNGFLGSTSDFNNPNNNNNGRQPLISENQIDKHTQNLTKEIEGLDMRLNKNQSVEPNYQRDRDNSQGYIPRMRDNSVNNNNNMDSAKKTFRGTQNSFNGNSTNTSLNGTFGQEKMNQQYFNGLDHFEQKENQLKEQLKQFEKEKQQKEKLQALQESAKKQSSNKLGQDKKEPDLQLKLSSPTFSKKKDKQKNSSNPFGDSTAKNKDFDLEGSTEYVPGNFGRTTETKMRGTLNNTRGFKKPPKPQPKNNDDEVAIATGIQDCPLEDSTQDTGELFTCPEGCGRQFKEEALKKHIPICKKVFQQKRNAFNTQSKRQVDEEQAKLNRQGQIKEKIVQKQKSREKSTSKKQSSNLADIKKKMKQQKEEQGGQKDELL